MKAPRLQLDFAPRVRKLSVPGMAALCVSAVVLAVTSLQLAQLLAGNAEQTKALAALEARRGVAAVNATRPVPAEPGELARMRAVRQVAQNLATPWAALLESLESAPNQSVALLSVEPSVAKRSLRITAEARNPPDMLAYLNALQQDARLSSVVLVSHQVQTQAPGTPLRFQLQAVWGIGP